MIPWCAYHYAPERRAIKSFDRMRVLCPITTEVVVQFLGVDALADLGLLNDNVLATQGKVMSMEARNELLGRCIEPIVEIPKGFPIRSSTFSEVVRGLVAIMC